MCGASRLLTEQESGKEGAGIREPRAPCLLKPNSCSVSSRWLPALAGEWR